MKQKTIELILLILVFCGISLAANADYDNDTALSLKEALKDSNADYNKHKKIAIREEFGRMEQWDNRDHGLIEINDAHTMEADQTEFKNENKDLEPLQEISLIEKD